MPKQGIVLLDKEAGMTSRKVDNVLQHRFLAKVGHLGTLDPFATGLLIVGVGKGTKFFPYLDGSRKSYLASLSLGKKTSTGDPEGEVTETKEVPPLDASLVQKAMDSFLGEGEQLPPMTSAIKQNGVALYRLARKGEEVERKPRKVHIYSFQLLRLQNNAVDFLCEVSEGTYIRVLGEDLAEKLGTVGHLESLRRLSIGKIDLRYAKKLADLTEDDILDPTLFLTSYPHIELNESEAKDAYNGKPLDLKQDYGETVILTENGDAIAAYVRVERTTYRCQRGLF